MTLSPRKYSLPNCTLILEGMSSTMASATESKPLMSILTRAECRFVGHDQPISGDSEFFNVLIQTASRYAQLIFSGIGVPRSDLGLGDRVVLKPLGLGEHLLIVQPSASSPGQNGSHGGASQSLQQLKLNSVQLFDLVEAIDQFFADTQTLPDLKMQLAPVPRRYAPRTQVVVDRTVPAAIGISSVVAATIAFSLLPVPEVKRPTSPTEPGQETSVNPATSPTTSPVPTAGSPPETIPQSPGVLKPGAATPDDSSPEPSAVAEPPDPAAVLEQATDITDPDAVVVLQDQFYAKLNQAWARPALFDQELVFRVGVSQDGDLIGYKFENPAAAKNVEKTPLLQLLYLPTEGGIVNAEAIAQFRVTFRPDGELIVEPWRE